MSANIEPQQKLADPVSFEAATVEDNVNIETNNLLAVAISSDQSAALNIHNNARHSKGLQPLHWDQNLCNDATQWAQHMAGDGNFHHSGVSGQGENLFWTSPNSTPYQSGAQAWINESKNYHGEKIGEGNFGSYGHYSKLHRALKENDYLLTRYQAQCMWHSTTKLGMGIAKDAKGNTYVVGRYSPPGNITGQKPY